MNPLAHSIYSAYPRKLAPKNAEKSILKALKELQEEEGISLLEAHQRLLEATMEYAVRVKDKERKFVPHPATWFNRGDHLCDPDEWGDAPLLKREGALPSEEWARAHWNAYIREEYRMEFPSGNWEKEYKLLPDSIRRELIQAWNNR